MDDKKDFCIVFNGNVEPIPEKLKSQNRETITKSTTDMFEGRINHSTG